MSDWRIESGGGGRKKEVEGETGTRDDARSARTEKRRRRARRRDETRREEKERERERGTKEGESMIGSNACERRRGTVDQTSRTSEASVWNEDVSISRQIEPHVPAPLIFITASGPYLHESPHHRPTKRQLGIPESNVSRPAIYIYIYTCTLLFAAPFEMDNRVEIGKVRDETCSPRRPLAEEGRGET